MVTVVAGAPRSGSSLMMRMLYMGGLDVVANCGRTSFEDDHCTRVPLAAAFITTCEGKAVKVLDPHRHRLPHGFKYRVIWMKRDYDEQARSQLKFLSLVGGMAIPNKRQAEKKIAASIEFDHRLSMAMLVNEYRSSMLRVSFESLLINSEDEAARVAAFCLPDALDVAAMAAVVVPRPFACLPGLLEAATVDAQR